MSGKTKSTPHPADPQDSVHSPHQPLIERLARLGLTVVTAESCTAGLIAAKLAQAPGAGKVLECAFVVYDPKAKHRCLDVPLEVLEHNNLTSEAVAREMALGALRHSDATVAIANTGVADDADPDIPAGTQCFAWVLRSGPQTHARCETRRFSGDRNAIREASADYALHRLAHHVAQWRSERAQD